MFTIYHSNQANLFKKLLINVMSNKLLSNPMQSEIILTEHSIIDQWIQIELANHFGVACNITFMTLTSFIQKNIVNNIIPDDSMVHNFSRSVMYWKFMKILSQTQIQKDCPIIEKYLKHDVNQQKISQFSEQLVNLFAQYLIYRPDWLNSWQSHKIIDCLDNTHQIWQSKIWRRFLENTQYNQQESNSNINPLQHCIYFLKNIKKINWNLPSRIFIFGITSIPPIYWKILKFLSYHIDIYLWFINSCYHNPDDISDQNSYVAKQQANQLYNNNLLHSSLSVSTHIYSHNNHTNNVHHPLLNSWNNTARNTLLLFTQLKDKIELKSFIIPKKDSVLHIVQKDILEFHNCRTNTQTNNNIPTLKPRQQYILTPEDQSITCHICHSIQREIEVLHNNLLLMITNDPLLTPGDIIVMAADIHRYTPAIQTIFNNIQGRHLPFNIADNHKKNTHPIISSFLNILNIPSSRFTSEEILSFLKVPSIASRFNMNKEEIELLSQWIIKSGIRWGLDNFTMHNFNLPITNQNTWNFGLTRMLLGYAIKNQNKIWEKMLPYDDTTIGEHTNIIGQLGEFLKTLKKWRNRLNHPYTLKKWILYFKEIIDDFFYYDQLSSSRDNKTLLLLKDCCRNILESGIQAEYTKSIRITALREKLCDKLHQNKIIHRFIPNVINFCNITPTVCIPCKVVCFLGMNDHSFPRNTILPDFNLIAKNPRKNDNNIYDQDCYSFLLAFLIAQERIYISFIEHSIYDNTINYPSSLINELFEYIALNFYLRESKNTEIDINIKYIRQRLCQWHNPFPFSPENFNSNSDKQSFAKEWLPTLNINTPNSPAIYPNFNTSLPHCTIKKIIFQDLYNFYRHPVRIWFQKRLNVFFDQNTLKLLNDEPFSVDGLSRYELNTKLINYLIYDKNINELYYSVCASGILPYGAFGELFWATQHSKMVILANQIKEHHCIEKYNLDISLVFDTIELVGQLTTVQKNGLIRWKPQYLSMKDILLLWLEHITYCAIGGKGDSRLFGVDDVWHFPNFSKPHAKKLLLILILGYCTGINTPILLLYRSGGAWMNYVFDWNTRKISSNPSYQKKASQKLIQIWKGTKYSLFRESHDPYLRKIIPFDLSEEDIRKITKTAEHYFFNFMKYRII
ncbi:exodeoxyribonuclease V subunit gamma [Blochmannia endosymbiont of Camponotus sp.]|uniref:exodeoxyribonuclease V subunit gamma n=1 Tax=Blochmannia endosymbiont of Camponotus sp. TaxID=700220 RepID=UPI0020244F6D|nr:exodeoxyribonuclease V subunit gamma [Blochmannia endosymbiont of Camponotus sp.]URJ30110.1 exodeoxyribonuclease V subunit gamma [Blochmannia endosymbiont of Camponotus sp.]